MKPSIHDDCFDELVQKGLLQDIINLASAMGDSFEVIPTMHGWRMTVKNASHTIQLERKAECLELAVLDMDRRKEYTTDSEGVVGAAIDLMKATAHG